jgi:hypothetical protein
VLATILNARPVTNWATAAGMPDEWSVFAVSALSASQHQPTPPRTNKQHH